MKPSEIASSLQVLAQDLQARLPLGTTGRRQIPGRRAQVAIALGIRLIDIRAILLD
jgi:hypothetical protein